MEGFGALRRVARGAWDRGAWRAGARRARHPALVCMCECRCRPFSKAYKVRKASFLKRRPGRPRARLCRVPCARAAGGPARETSRARGAPPDATPVSQWVAV